MASIVAFRFHRVKIISCLAIFGAKAALKFSPFRCGRSQADDLPGWQAGSQELSLDQDNRASDVLATRVPSIDVPSTRYGANVRVHDYHSDE
jgi:hypothetical protein